MEFNRFFRVCYKLMGFSNLNKFVISCFEAANKNDEYLTEDMAGNWIKELNQGYKKILNEKSRPFNDTDFIDFFKMRTTVSWVEIQNKFKAEPDKAHVIDCNTTEQDVFLQSVMNQFKELIGYPYELPVEPTLQDNETKAVNKAAHQEEVSSEQMYEILNGDFQGYNVMGFIKADPLEPMNSYLFEDVDMFLNEMKYYQEHSNILDKREEKYQKMIKFTNALSDYVGYLREHMTLARAFENENSSRFDESARRDLIEIRNFKNISPRPYYAWYEPPKYDGGEFENKTKNYRDQLKELPEAFYDIDIEKENNSIFAELRSIDYQRKG